MKVAAPTPRGFRWIADGVRQGEGVVALVSYPELAYFLEDVGFQRVRTFNRYEDRAASDLSGRRILVAAEAPADRRRAS